MSVIPQYKLVESEVEDNLWRIYVKRQYWGWKYLATLSGLGLVANYVALDRKERSPR